ncbi:MAG: cell division protein FtsZ [Bacteroidia bacterium]|nr:cell division protein FtsZ [Bacteroidia bacterium]
MNLEESIAPEVLVKSSAKIRVIGVGGAGCNAVEYMKFGRRINGRKIENYETPASLVGVDYWICNTDYQHIENIPIENKIQLGPRLTNGLGAGSNPEKGELCAKESMKEIEEMLEGADMVFVTAGMGGGTGTGAAPVIAKTAKDKGILTVAVVSIPFIFEREEKLKIAYEGIKKMIDSVDSLIVLNSECLKDMYGELGLSKSFAKADQVLSDAVRGVSEIIAKTGAKNVDFADIRTFMEDSGVAFIGTGIAEGKDRAIEAVKQALSSPIINNRDIRGSKHVIIFFQSDEEGDYEVTQGELTKVAYYINSLIDDSPEAGQGKLKFGSVHEPELDKALKVTIVATGFQENVLEPNNVKSDKQKTYALDVDGGLQEVITEYEDEQPAEIELSSTQKEILTKMYKQTPSAVEEDVKFDLSSLKDVSCLPLSELLKEEVLSVIENESSVSRRRKK